MVEFRNFLKIFPLLIYTQWVFCIQLLCKETGDGHEIYHLVITILCQPQDDYNRITASQVLVSLQPSCGMQLHIQGGWGRKVLEISESHSYMLKVFFKTGILKEGQLFRRSLGTRHSSGFWVLELFRKIYSRNHLHCG